MSKLNDLYPSNYLKAEDIEGHEPIVTICSIKVQEFGLEGEEKERKPVLYFEGKEKGMALNVTNARTIAMILGSEETDDWIGKRIKLHMEIVTYLGKPTKGIRVRGVDATAQAKPTPAPASTLEKDDISF